MNRACLIEDCRADVRGGQLFCWAHWKALTPAIRETIIFLQNNPHSKEGLEEAKRSAVEQIRMRLDPQTAWPFRIDANMRTR